MNTSIIPVTKKFHCWQGPLWAIPLSIVTTKEALAYVDPGSGTFLLQILAAAGVGALFYLRHIKNWVKELFSRRQRGPEAVEDGKDETSE